MGWKERIPVVAHADTPAQPFSYLMGLTAAAGPAQGSSSTLTTAGICTFPWRADGLGHWKETQGTKISRKSSSTDCAPHGINFYCWSGRAAPQGHFL